MLLTYALLLRSLAPIDRCLSLANLGDELLWMALFLVASVLDLDLFWVSMLCTFGELIVSFLWREKAPWLVGEKRAFSRPLVRL